MNELNSLTLNEKTYDRFAGNLPKPATAKVGQVLVVAAVDDDGNVTEVDAVDQSSGGGTAGGGDGFRLVVESVANIGGCVSVTVTDYKTHALYNGVRLPKIPEDVLANYPYAWIRNDGANGNYNLVVSKTPWYYSGANLTKGTGDSIPYYSIPISGYLSATDWGSPAQSNTEFGLASNRTVLWSNHDIPDGSATSTNIYFAGSEPVPTT